MRSACEERDFEALPAAPDVVALFAHIEAEKGRAPVTIGRRVAAINYHHRQDGVPSPVQRDTGGIIAEMMAGIRRKYETAKDQKALAQADVLKAMLETITGMSHRRRAPAILAIGMAGALRRSEIAALKLGDLSFERSGVRIAIRKSKRDQEAKGQTVAIPEGRFIRPVALLKHWLYGAALPLNGFAEEDHRTIPVFRRVSRSDGVSLLPISDKAVARLVKKAALDAGLDPALYSAHSLHAGFLTEAAGNRASPFKMMDHSRHKSFDTVADYVRDAALFDEHAGEGFL